ncbi:unnamed protein product [Vitrella brassicaformis CCMP3155]|uniref:TLDc domain-containing protein n=1 Tax=Vitrella brassicaformis (strain CCMP3155) TaxID=1169540 RepID=A0A0G4FDU6_VITBC|nr:unnamed protein product [Vitrella brassicaformis CCMP3155]|eukprot:CEM11370.1 unnamed protein product [Vitrella brassicaformis CCMP3155]
MLELLGGCETIDGDLDASIQRLMSAKSVLTEVTSRLVAERGGVSHPPETKGEMLVNAGGVVFPVSRRALLLPLMRKRYISVLLMHFSDGLPRDPDGHVYLEASPAYFEAFLDELTLHETHRTGSVELPPSKAADPTYSEYHSLFMRELQSFSAPTHRRHGAATTKAVDGACDEKAIADIIQTSLSDLEKVMKRLTCRREEVVKFLSAMEPFMKGQDDARGDSAVLSLDVMGRKVSCMKRTLQRLGNDHPLLTRFSNTPPCWGDRRVRQTPTKHFVNTVDFARRISVLPKGQLIRPPLMDEAEQEWVSLLDMIKKPMCRPSLLFKSSRDGSAYATMLDCVAGKSGLLFALRDGDTHRFGCFLGGQITPPADPKQTNRYKMPLFFFSLSGAYEAPTKIELPEDRQTVGVAGTQGASKNDMDEPLANVCIACGYLWLGFAQPGPAADLSSCHLWIKRDQLPEGYKGGYTQQGNGDGLMARTMNFTSSPSLPSGGEEIPKTRRMTA